MPHLHTMTRDMMRLPALVVTNVCLLQLLGAPVWAQVDAPAIRRTSQEVVLDLVVRASAGNYTEFRRKWDNVLNNALLLVQGVRGGVEVTAATDANQSSSMSVAGAASPSPKSEPAMLLARIEQKQLDMVTYTAGW